MNLYVVVEGQRTEPQLYRRWLPFLVPGLREVQRIEDADANTFFLVAGMGYPSYKERIRQAVADCTGSNASFQLVVCVDAEDATVSARTNEIVSTIQDALRDTPDNTTGYTTVVADCCIETWLLGNSKLIKRTPENSKLREYHSHYNVVVSDPELMPVKTGDRNRADTHLNYLKAAFLERGLRYSKKKPGEAQEHHYFEALVNRATSVQPDGTRHLGSFAQFLSVAEVFGVSPTGGQVG